MADKLVADPAPVKEPLSPVEGVGAAVSDAPAKENSEDKHAKSAVEGGADSTEKSTEEQDNDKKEDDAAATEVAEMKDAGDNEEAASAPAAGQEGLKTPVKSGKDRRKSAGGSTTKSKKASRASLATNTEAQPGEQFLVKLKGFPPWPVIIADESMLPEILTNHRPVSAMKADGTWNEPFADGGKRINERKLPIMYLHTNEFGWTSNTLLQPLSAERATEALSQSSKMKKDLKLAFELASEENSLDYYKDLLQRNQEALLKEQEKEVARAKAAAAAAAKKGKTKAKDVDGDLDMPDDQPEDESEGAAPKSKKSKKRKAEEEISTVQRTDSVKKPKIKLTTSGSKPSNGVAEAKATAGAGKEVKVKIKKPATKDDRKDSKVSDMSPVNKRKREVLFLRHRMQRGMLMKDQGGPKAEDMPSMSDHLTKLEGYPELEASIMRETKINKVLKAILKLADIPREAEFKFKERSAAVLEKWNKILAADAGAEAPPPPSNGIHGAEGRAVRLEAEAPETGGGKDVEMPDRTREEGVETTKPEEAATEAEAEATTAKPVEAAT